jgi:hypothetical protein
VGAVGVRRARTASSQVTRPCGAPREPKSSDGAQPRPGRARRGTYYRLSPGLVHLLGRAESLPATTGCSGPT